MLDPAEREGTTAPRSLRFSLLFHPAALPMTRRGDAALAAHRLVDQVCALDPVDRAYIAGLLRWLVEDGDDAC